MIRETERGKRLLNSLVSHLVCVTLLLDRMLRKAPGPRKQLSSIPTFAQIFAPFFTQTFT
jgi:hypothetical protein